MYMKFKIGDKVRWTVLKHSWGTANSYGGTLEVVGNKNENGNIACRNEKGNVSFFERDELEKVHELKRDDEVFVKAKYCGNPLFHPTCRTIMIEGKTIEVSENEIYLKNEERKLIPFKPTTGD